MSGKWLPPKKEKKKHRCEPPDLNYSTASPGRRWGCDCGVVWVVMSVSQHGESWRAWEREK